MNIKYIAFVALIFFLGLSCYKSNMVITINKNGEGFIEHSYRRVQSENPYHKDFSIENIQDEGNKLGKGVVFVSKKTYPTISFTVTT